MVRAHPTVPALLDHSASLPKLISVVVGAPAFGSSLVIVTPGSRSAAAVLPRLRRPDPDLPGVPVIFRRQEERTSFLSKRGGRP